MHSDDYGYIILHWRGHGRALDKYPTNETDDYIYQTHGELAILDDEDEEITVGKFRLYYIDVERGLNEGVHAFDILDTYSETVEYYEALFDDEEGTISERIPRLFGEDVFLNLNVLIFDRLEILPEFRGKGIGFIAMRELMARFSSGVAVVAIKPFPLQFEITSQHDEDADWRRKLSLETFSKREAPATKRLRDHYRTLGFKPVC